MVLDQLEGRTLYSLDDKLHPGVAGFNEMRAELHSSGGGNVWRVWTTSGGLMEQGQPGVPFPMTFEQIARLFAAALHARHVAPEPETKEGA